MLRRFFFSQVIDFERDINLAKSGKEDLIYKTLIGLKKDLSKPTEVPEILAAKQRDDDDNDTGKESDDREDSEDDSEEEEDENKEEKTEDENTDKLLNTVRQKDESLETKKAGYLLFLFFHVKFSQYQRVCIYCNESIHVRFQARKKAIKEYQAEKRKNKIKKHVKKRKMKKNK